jgi:hypothetical protein
METLTIKNRTDIEVPERYRREFEVPADAKRYELVDKIKERCGLDWQYLNLMGLDFSYTSLNGANLTGAKDVNFSDMKCLCFVKHARIILIPGIIWEDREPIAAVMPEGDQPLLISIGYKTHTPEVWKKFTTNELRRIHETAPGWFTAHMESAIKKAYELEAEFLKIANKN